MYKSISSKFIGLNAEKTRKTFSLLFFNFSFLFSPSVVIDLATLTGACVVALGEYASGLFTNDDSLKDELLSASQKVFERTWPVRQFQLKFL